jgi:hypothetical protein
MKAKEKLSQFSHDDDGSDLSDEHSDSDDASLGSEGQESDGEDMVSGGTVRLHACGLNLDPLQNAIYFEDASTKLVYERDTLAILFTSCNRKQRRRKHLKKFQVECQREV